jgi:hypothetical protein
MSDPTRTLSLDGGRYDGAVLDVTPEQHGSTVVVLVDAENQPEIVDTTIDGTKALLYVAGDLEDDPADYDGPGVYHRCRDGLFRPSKAKKALGL